MKRLLHLGGAPAQVPAIQYAVEAGYHVITADYLPDNPGHAISHEYYDISTTDASRIYELARTLNIDGIASFASDPAAPTVGYVAERLGLKGPGEIASRTLSDKGLFRKMMKNCGLETPGYQLFDNPKEATHYLGLQEGNRMVKPVDSSGSKGVFHYTGQEDCGAMIQEAFGYSRKKEVIIEEYIPSESTQIQGEGFVVSGELIFAIFGDQKLSAFNPAAPASTSFPSRHTAEDLASFHAMTEKVLQSSGFQNGGINIEIIQDTDGHYHLLELGPRSGGNFMPQLVKRSTGVDLVKMCIDNAMGKEVPTPHISQVLPHSQLILHSSRSGTFRSLSYKQDLKEHIMDEYIYKQDGDAVQAYRGSQDVIGVSLFDTLEIGEPQNRHLRIQDHIDLKLDE